MGDGKGTLSSMLPHLGPTSTQIPSNSPGSSMASHNLLDLPSAFSKNEKKKKAQKLLLFPTLQKGPRSHTRGSHQDHQSIEEVDDHTGMGQVRTKDLPREVLVRGPHLQLEPRLLLVLTLDTFSCWRFSVILRHTVLPSSECVNSCLSQLCS